MKENDKNNNDIVGQVLNGKYRVIEEIGRGGFAEVFHGIHSDLNRPVAIKVITTEWVDHNVILKRFEREAQALAQLAHPNIVNLLDYGVFENRPYLVMELIPGETLGKIVVDGPLDVERARSITHQILLAIQFAHEKGIAHRDLKPENIVLQSLPHAEHVKILDFGFAKFISPDHPTKDDQLSQAGVAFGTPTYIAPEQIAGAPADHRVDFYAAGVLLYEMLSGRRPFEGDPVEVLTAKINSTAPLLQEFVPDEVVTKALNSFLVKALENKPENRFQDASEMLEAFELIPKPMLASTKAKQGNKSIPIDLRNRKHQLGLIGAGLAISLLALWIFSGPESSRDEEGTTAVTSQKSIEEVIEQSLEEEDDSPFAIPSAPDPFADQSDLPPLIAQVYEMVKTNKPPTQEQTKKLRLYSQLYTDDPRADLLLGHIYYARKWYPDSMSQYEKAYRINTSARGDPRMLVHLILMVKRSGIRNRASFLIKSYYGKDALRAIERAIESTPPNSNDADVLIRLRKQLAE